MHDFVIIGSGVSGGRIAWELTRAGARCLLLEAGREYDRKSFPDNEMDYSAQLFWGGGLEVSSDGHVGFLRAKCVGGTSIVNQALLDRFDDLAWDQWRDKSGVSFLNSREMEAHYVASSEKLSIHPVEERFYNRNAKIFMRALSGKGFGWRALDRAQSDCALEHGTDCMACLGGCPRDSKQSSLVTTIRWAREKGLEVRSEFEVHHIEYGKDEVRIVGTQAGAPAEVRAPRVVLAAGALGNSAILLRSGMKKKLPALGTGFACHPQFMTYAAFDEPVDAHKGAFQAVKSHDPKLRKMGFKLENVFAPPIGTAMLMPGYGGIHLAKMKKYRFMASMEVAIQDDAVGTVRVAGDKMTIEKPLSSADQAKAKRGLELVRGFFEGVGAQEIISCPQTFGLHLMGGCPIGTDEARSVVDPEFRVHGHPRLFCGDSSIFPAAPGINPSFTVMALSHRASQSILKEAR